MDLSASITQIHQMNPLDKFRPLRYFNAFLIQNFTIFYFQGKFDGDPLEKMQK